MKEKRKSYFIPSLYLLILFAITVGIYFTKKAYDNYQEESFDNITYVSNTILNRTIPIVQIQDTISKPYSKDDIEIARYFYNPESTFEEKVKSIVFYGDTYMQNTGIDYISKDIFDVLSVYDGTVIDIEDNELLGKTVKIRHSAEVISVYQGLSDIEVVKGDVVFKDQKIGTSGVSKINKDLGNHLHFEIYKNGETIDPLKCIEKKLGDI